MTESTTPEPTLAAATPHAQPPHAPLPEMPRRTFFHWLTCTLSGVAAVVLGGPILGYFLKPRESKVEWIPLGPLDSFPLGKTRLMTFDNPLRAPWDGDSSHTGVFVRYEGKDADQQENFLVLAVNCAHLGCPVSWFPQSGLFMCPCHGGVYYANGERASGPPPRGLFKYTYRIKEGQLEVRAPHYPTLQDTLDQPV